MADQLALARWCQEQKLFDQERAHLVRVLKHDPDHAKARARLGYVRIEDEWIGLGEISNAFAEQARIQSSLTRYSRDFERLARALSDKRQSVRERAADAVRAIRDVEAIPSLERLIAGRNEEAAKLVLTALAKMPEKEASLSIARFASLSSSYRTREGEALDAEHAGRIANEVYDSWHGDAQVPARFLVVSRSQSLSGGVGPEMEVHLIEPGRRYHFYERERSQRVVHVADKVRHDLDRQIGPWRRDSRDYEVETKRDDEVFRRFPDDQFPYLGPDFHGFLTVSRAIDAMPAFKFERVARIDDLRYRIDFKPFAAPRDEDDARILVIDPQVTEWSCVVRSDLEWAPEESKIVQMIQQSSWNAPKRYERQISQRFERRGDFVFLTERAVRDGSGPPGTVMGNQLTLHVYAHEIDPDYDERIFDPQSLDPEPWPDRRELPWLRWYRVTFLLGCGMAVALIGRRFMPKRTTLEAPDEPRETDAEVTTTT